MKGPFKKKKPMPLPTDYQFKDWVGMKPGSILPGLTLCRSTDVQTLRVGTAWNIQNARQVSAPTAEAPLGVYRPLCFVEGYIDLRNRIKRKRVTKKSLVTFYYPEAGEIFELFVTTKSDWKTMKIDLVVGEPIGIFLGHVIRDSEHTLINFLTFSGLDLWI